MKKVLYLILIVHCTLKIDNCMCQSQFQRTIGGTGADYANSIIQTTDGGYAAAGYTFSFGAGLDDMYIVKLDGSGTIQWSRTVGGTNYDYAYSIIQTTDGGYAVSGYTYSFGAGSSDFYIVKLNNTGTLQWSRTVGGTGDEGAWSIIQTTDGGYAVAGQTQSFGAGSYDFYIVKLNSSGTLQWSRTAGGTGDEGARSIIQTTDSGYAVAGWANSFGAGASDMYIVKLDGGGTLQWSKTVGGTNFDVAYSIIRTTDGGYAVSGLTRSFGAGGDDMYIVKFDASWNTCGNSTSPSSLSGTGGILGTPTPIVNSPTSTVTTPSPTTSTGGTVTAICTTVGIQPISNEAPRDFSLSQNYPNPFNPETIINFQSPMFNYVKLSVYDILGREVVTLVDEELKPGTYEVQWDAVNYPSGVYYYRLTAGGFQETKKMILLK